MVNESKGEIVIYQTPDGRTALDVKLAQETVWLNLNQLAALFERDKSVISRHIRNVFSENELEAKSVVAKIATTAADGKIYQVEYFNLDMIIAVGANWANNQEWAEVYLDGKKRMGDNALVALTLLIAESNPQDKATIIKVIVNLINRNN